MGGNRPTVQRALDLDVLTQDKWLEVRQVGESGTVRECLFIINDRVAWATGRDGLRYSLFSAAVASGELLLADRRAI